MNNAKYETFMNYTRPHDPDHEDAPEDWLKSAGIFARTISLCLKPNEGIVVDLVGEMKFPGNDKIKKVVVYCKNNQVIIDPFEKDLKEGSRILVLDGSSQN